MLKPLSCALMLASSALALPSLTGTVQDESKQPVADARITVWGTGGEKHTTSSDSAGAFVLADLAEGEYLLSAEKRGEARFLGAVRLKADAAHPVTIHMTAAHSKHEVAAGAALRVAKASETEADAHVDITQPRLIWREMPAAPKSRKSGAVHIAAVMLTDGTLDELAALSAPDEALTRSALAAVMRWRYSPALVNGVTHEVSFTVDVNFSVSRQ